MARIIQKLFQKNIQYNILSLINVGMGFIFIILLGRKFGASEQTDIYFLSLVLVAYLGLFVSSAWIAIKQYYIELKTNDIDTSKEVYIILLNNIIIISMIIILIYFFVTAIFDFLDEDVKEFLNIFIFYLLFSNILSYNKIILNLDYHFASIYIVDIFVYMVNLLVMAFLVENDIILIAYSTLIATLLAILWQWSLIFKKNNIKYRIIFYKKNILQEIYKNSFKINLGSILCNSKDIMVATIFTSYGNGIYSLFSYANKFAGVILQIVNAPIVAVFTAHISLVFAKKNYDKVGFLIKEVLIKTILLFLFSSVIIYFILPYILNIFFGDNFSLTDIITIQYVFIYLVVYFSFLTIELPFVKVLNLLKFFNYGLFVNVIFFFMISIGYLAVQLLSLDYESFLIFLILSQLTKVLFYIHRYRLEMMRLVGSLKMNKIKGVISK